MKKIVYLLLLAATFSACKKTQTKKPSLQAKCILQSETLNFSGSRSIWEYTYAKDGNIILMKLFIGGDYHVIRDSIIVSSYKTEAYQGNSSIGIDQITKLYNANFMDILPTICDVSINFSDGNGLHNHYSYFFSYDNKSRLIKVRQQTNGVGGVETYQLMIDYNDQDNAIQLSLEQLTGTREIVHFIATGYDDKVNPYAALKYWPFIMDSPWTDSEAEDIFKCLSKNNILGFRFHDRTQTIAYKYNDNGFPIEKDYTNTNLSGSSTSTYQAYYTYLCK